jgi:hypothetical protein
MAAKIAIMKLLQEIRGFAEITNRRPQPRSPGLFLMQLRSQMTHPVVPNRKRSIIIEMHDLPNAPAPVKIVHRRRSPTSASTAAAR